MRSTGYSARGAGISSPALRFLSHRGFGKVAQNRHFEGNPEVRCECEGIQGEEYKKAVPDFSHRDCSLSYGGGAGNRTPVRQGPTTSFSVRSLRFYVGSGLPETGCHHPSPLGLDLAFESITRGAVAIGDVRRESWRRKPPGTWTLFKRPVRNYRWQLLFAPCFTSSGNSARCP